MHMKHEWEGSSMALMKKRSSGFEDEELDEGEKLLSDGEGETAEKEGDVEGETAGVWNVSTVVLTHLFPTRT
jgi:hypothetical protein